MSSVDRARRPSGARINEILGFSALGALMLLAAGFTGALHLAAAFDPNHPPLSWHPMTLIGDLGHSRSSWPQHSALFLVGVGMVQAVTVAVVVPAVIRLLGHRGLHIAAAAARMGSGLDLDRVTGRGALEQATRLGVGAPGISLGTTVRGRRELYQGWEDVSVIVAGPRVGKTTAVVVPAIMQAPGAVLTTSNKRDIVDLTRGPRDDVGPVWVFDPQGVVDEPPAWWWNPLRYVTGEVRAANLADVFAAASTNAEARADAFFEPKGQKLVTGLLMAAACGGHTIDRVYTWVTHPRDDEPVLLLERHGHDLLAESVRSEILAPDKQRGGVYGTAEKMLAFLTNRQALTWVTPGSGRPEFVPDDFVRTRGTLYSLSKEGRGSAGALVAGLTVAVTEAAEDLARTAPSGRLPVPVVVVLDEAANVCRWPELPNLYSHFGSRGIVLMTVLQSWSQGVAVWGREGMRKLWSAATVKLYAGGVSEVEFLTELAQLVGEFTNDTETFTWTQTGRSTSRATQRERILDVSDLAAMPRGLALTIVSGARPTLLRLRPWMAGPYANRIRASLNRTGPTDTGTPSTSQAGSGATAWLAAASRGLDHAPRHRPGRQE